MKPIKRNITIYQGATYVDRLVWSTGEPEDAIPVDLTGCTAFMQIRASATSAVVLLELSTSNGRITLGGVDGTIEMRIEAADTTPIDWRGGVYDLEIVFADGYVRRFMEGIVAVSPEITRA